MILKMFAKGMLKSGIIAAGALLFAACAGGKADNGGDGSSGVEVSAPSAVQTDVSRLPVRVVEVVREDIREVLDLTGTAQAWDEFQVSSEIPGRIASLRVDQGDWVQRGDLLLELEQEKRLIELQSREANLARNRVELEFAKKRRERGRALLEKGAMSESELDSLDQAVQIAETGVRMAQISIDSIRQELEDTEIRSPVAGRISRRTVSLGETVSPSAPLFTIIQVNPIKVRTELAEPYLHKIKPGQRVALVFESVSPREFSGKIHFIHPVANPQSGAFPTEIRLENPAGLFQPGLVARVRLEAEVFRQALVAPLDAIVESKGEKAVFVVTEGHARRRPISIVRRIGSRAIVQGQLEAGDRVVTEGNSNITDGAPVEVLS